MRDNIDDRLWQEKHLESVFDHFDRFLLALRTNFVAFSPAFPGNTARLDLDDIILPLYPLGAQQFPIS